MTSVPAVARFSAGVLLSLTLALVGCATARAQQPTAATAPAAATPEAVVAAVVAARGERYAGDCLATRSPQDRGALCSRLIAERGGRRAYLLGRTFSEFGWWLFVDRAGSGWRGVATAPLAFFDPSGSVPWPP